MIAVQRYFNSIVNLRNYSLKMNTVANFAGGVWGALISLLFVPIYLHYLGVEAYGIIGIFLSLQTFLWLFDFGLSPALNRELARLSAFPDKAREMHDLTKTLEIINWLVSVLVGVILLAASPLIAYYWVQPGSLSQTSVLQCLLIMSVSTAVQFPVGLYTGGLMGLQRQAAVNIINSVFLTARAVGAVCVLVFVSQTLQAFLLWQVVVGALQTLTTAFYLRLNLPKISSAGRFQSALLRQVLRFASGLTAIGIVAMILTQADKVILSRMLTLEFFGYYTLATTIPTMGLGVIMSAINNAVYPEFSRLAALDDETALCRLYHYSCQLMSVLIIPTAMLLAVFAPEILRLWTHNEAIVANASILLSLSAIGTAGKGLLWLPYHLQLAYGWTKLSFYANLVGVLVLIPLMVVGVIYYGAIGGAAAWVVLHIGHILFTMNFMHRRLLKGELLKWYFRDVGLPLIAALTVGGLGRLVAFAFPSPLETVGLLVATFALAIAAASLAAPEVRRQVFSYFKIYFPHQRKV